MDPDGTGKRYTIEFGYDEKSQKYRIRQLETAYNKGGSTLLRERIEKLIN
jgi:hypothetical protein